MNRAPQVPALAVANFLMEATCRRRLGAGVEDVLLVDNLLIVEFVDDAPPGSQQQRLEALAQRSTFGLTEALDAGVSRDHWNVACDAVGCDDPGVFQVHFELKFPTVVAADDDPRQRRRTPVFVNCDPDMRHALHYRPTVFAPPSEAAAALPELASALPSREHPTFYTNLRGDDENDADDD